MAPVPFTGISAATSSDSLTATVFQGRFLPEEAGRRGSTGWAFVPNLPDVLRQVEQGGIHHFVALKGKVGRAVTDALRFRGITVSDQSADVPDLDDTLDEIPPLGSVPARVCTAFTR